jgi:hypothetical protein
VLSVIEQPSEKTNCVTVPAAPWVIGLLTEVSADSLLGEILLLLKTIPKGAC